MADQIPAPKSNGGTSVGVSIELDLGAGQIVVCIREPLAIRPVCAGLPINEFWETIGTLMVATSREMRKLEAAAAMHNAMRRQRAD